MAKIILIGTQKGGTGKSTVTTLLANALAAEPFKKRVFVADCDPQQSVIKRRLADVRTFEAVPPYKIEAKNLAELKADAQMIDAQNDYLFLDVAGRLDASKPADEQETTRFLAFADFLFVPFVAGNFAFESSLDYLKAALKIRAARASTARPLQIFGFVNMAEPRTADDRHLADEIAEFSALVSLPFMAARLNRYATFRATDTLASSYNPNGDKAQKNLAAFADEFFKITSKK